MIVIIYVKPSTYRSCTRYLICKDSVNSFRHNMKKLIQGDQVMPPLPQKQNCLTRFGLQSQKASTFGDYNQIEEIKGTFALNWHKRRQTGPGPTVSIQILYSNDCQGGAGNKKRIKRE